MNRFVARAIKEINLQPVKRVTVSFDPFHEHVRSVRHFLYAVSNPKAQQTNAGCELKTEIKSDRSEPAVNVKFDDGSSLLLKTQNLQLLEILGHFNGQCESRAAPPPVVETSTSGKLGKVSKKGKR